MVPVAIEQDEEVTVVSPQNFRPGLHHRELWQFRSMVTFFGDRLLTKLYVRTRLGRAWIPMRPILDVGARVLLFGAVLGASSGGELPYPLFLLLGMTLWMFFERSLFWGVRSIELNERVAKQILFPRIVLPLSAYWPTIIEFGWYLLLLAFAIAGYSIADDKLYLQLSPALLLAPVAVLAAVALTLGLNLFLSVFGAVTRDVRFSLSYAVQLWFFVTPIAFPLERLTGHWQTIASVNPVATPIELFRLGLTGEGVITPAGALSTLTLTALLLAVGVWFFTRAEQIALDSR